MRRWLQELLCFLILSPFSVYQTFRILNDFSCLSYQRGTQRCPLDRSSFSLLVWLLATMIWLQVLFSFPAHLQHLRFLFFFLDICVVQFDLFLLLHSQSPCISSAHRVVSFFQLFIWPCDLIHFNPSSSSSLIFFVRPIPTIFSYNAITYYPHFTDHSSCKRPARIRIWLLCPALQTCSPPASCLFSFQHRAFCNVLSSLGFASPVSFELSSPGNHALIYAMKLMSPAISLDSTTPHVQPLASFPVVASVVSSSTIYLRHLIFVIGTDLQAARAFSANFIKWQLKRLLRSLFSPVCVFTRIWVSTRLSFLFLPGLEMRFNAPPPGTPRCWSSSVRWLSLTTRTSARLFWVGMCPGTTFRRKQIILECLQNVVCDLVSELVPEVGVLYSSVSLIIKKVCCFSAWMMKYTIIFV